VGDDALMLNRDSQVNPPNPMPMTKEENISEKNMKAAYFVLLKDEKYSISLNKNNCILLLLNVTFSIF